MTEHRLIPGFYCAASLPSSIFDSFFLLGVMFFITDGYQKFNGDNRKRGHLFPWDMETCSHSYAIASSKPSMTQAV